MCRFMIVRSAKPFRPQDFILSFADMAENSVSLDGDWQGDGWGVCWLEPDNLWQQKRSLNPVWDEKSSFSRIPETRALCVHARSASFPWHKANFNFNQPFINGRYAFVFNGLIKGIRYPGPAEGEIGSQKIWSILQNHLRLMPPEKAVNKLASELERSSKEIQALNVGLCETNGAYAFCRYDSNKAYYHLHLSSSNGMSILSSEPLQGYRFIPVQTEQVVVF